MALGEPRVAVDRLLQRADLPFAIADLLVEPRQVERRLEAVRMQLQFLDVLALGGLDVAALLGEERQVEVREPDVGLAAMRFADQALGGRRVAALQRDHAERVLRGRDVRVDLERAPEQLPRRVADRRDRARSRPSDTGRTDPSGSSVR